MNAQQLKNAILQEAIEGRLVPQDPNDEPASVLLQRIRKEKERLVKEGKLKKKDLEVKPISEEEKPFEIPEGWEWVRLGSICDYLHRGKSPKYGDKKILPIMAQKCNQWDRIYTDRCLFAQEDTIEKYSEEQYLKEGDVIINSTGGGTVGRTGYVDDYVFNEYKKFVADSHVTVVRGNKEVLGKYLYYFLISPLVQYGLEDRCSGSTNQIELGTSTISDYLFPLPPLAEQKRIVAKIEELMPKVEEYGKAQEALDKLNAELPERLKKSILQEAISGRLVPQDPNDEPASILLDRIRQEKQRLVKEGKLKKKDLEEKHISEDEIPFEIPESWEWCSFGNVIFLLSGRDLTPQEYSDNKNGIPYITGASNFDGESLIINRWTTKPITISKYGDLLITCKGTIGTMAFNLIGDIHIARQVMSISPYLIDIKYIKFVLMRIVYELDKKAKSIIPGISREDILNALFPLPPLAEQHRIVAKLEQLLGEIDKLKV